MKRKSIIACVLSTLVLTASLNLSFATYAAEEGFDNAEAAFEYGNGLGYIEDNLPFKVPYASGGSGNAGLEILRTGLGSYYNGYELGRLPAVRNQGEEGACWAFTAMGAVEADLISDNAFSNSAIDLSELQLAYFVTHNYDDPKDCHDGDTRSFYTSDPSIRWLSSGGNNTMAYRSMANGIGVINESFMPYKTGSELDGYTPNEGYALGFKTAHLKGAYSINLDQKTEIKNAIREHGGVATSIYFDDAFGRNCTYRDSAHYAYYCSNSFLTNHGVLIVGWDDDFDRTNFKESIRPSENGAWLVRNSWGYNGYGKNGYFWISYEDAAIGGNENAAYIFDVDTNVFDNCYSYSGEVFRTGYIENINRVITEYDVRDGEKIEAVGFETGSSNFTATATVSDGIREVSCSKTTTFAGFYTIEFEDGFVIDGEENKRIRIDITFSQPVTFIIESDPGQYNVDNSGFGIRVTNANESTVKRDQTTYNGFFAYSVGYQTPAVVAADPSVKLYTNSVENITRVTGVSLDRSSVSLKAGEIIKLTETVSPQDADDKNVVWVSSDNGIATVDNLGNVTGVAVGTAEVSAVTSDGGYRAACTVTVLPTAVSGVTLSETSKTMIVGHTATLSATVLPANATNKNVTWSSSDEDVAQVSGDGVLTAVAPGRATVTVTTADGSKTAECAVTVNPDPLVVYGVSLNKSSLTMYVGDTSRLTATVVPSTALNRNVTWNSTNPDAVTVDSYGNITAVGEGGAYIQACTVDGGFEATCEVTVTKRIIPVTGIRLRNTDVSVDIGTYIWLDYDVLPSNATNSNVTVTSSNPDAVYVPGGDRMTACGYGISVITLKTEDGGYEASFTVKVEPPKVSVTGVNLGRSSISMKTGETFRLTASVSPSGATDKSVKWSSTDSKVAKVDSSGNITALSAGTTRITVTTIDGGYTASCTVTVTEPENKDNTDTVNPGINDDTNTVDNTDNKNNTGTKDDTNTVDNTDNKNNTGTKDDTSNRDDTNGNGSDKTDKNKSDENGTDADEGDVNRTDANKTDENKTDKNSTDTDGNDNTGNEEKKTNPYEKYGLSDEYVPDGYEDNSGSPMIIEGKEDCTWNESVGKSYWYEGGIKQGTYYDPKGVIGDGTNRGREICDINIKDDNGNGTWFWLDACYDGAKAVGKEVWVPYIYQNEDEWDEETRRSIAYESDEGMGECVLNAIMNKAGKWVRYDENGRMLKGWVTIEGRLAEVYPDQAGNTYYYDTRTGLMAKGWVTLEGKTYFFDEVSGVLVP